LFEMSRDRWTEKSLKWGWEACMCRSPGSVKGGGNSAEVTEKKKSDMVKKERTERTAKGRPCERKIEGLTRRSLLLTLKLKKPRSGEPEFTRG